MSTQSTPRQHRTDDQLADYVRSLAEAHGVSGYTLRPDGTVLYAAYADGDYDLRTQDGWLTDAEGDLTSPESLDGRGSLLALRDEHGSEQYDLVTVEPDSGAVTPVLADEHMNVKARQHPTDPDRIAFVSSRDRSLDLYTLDLADGAVTRHSEADEPVLGYAWSPDGDRLVYQAGTFEDTSLRVVTLSLGRDDLFVDEPDSEQALAFTDDGRGAWSEHGLVFTTNHETGYRELAVADADGEYSLRYANNRDKYEPQWTDDGDIVFLEAHVGDRRLSVLADGAVSVLERRGMNVDVAIHDGAVYYEHRGPHTTGELRRDGTTVVPAGRPAVPTVAPEEVSYDSFDGQAIAARLYSPPGDPVGAVVKPHGGPEAQHYNRLDMVTQTLVRAGFAVIAPDFRGSLGYGRAFRKASDADLGGEDLADVVAAAAYLRERGHERVGILGASYGGYMALMGVGTTDAFDMGASVCGVVNWETTVENARAYLGDVVMRKLGGTPAEDPDLYEARSPITYTDEIDVPLLVVQGANDPRVPQSEAEQLVYSLADRSVAHEYLLFDDEGHGVVGTENRIEYLTRVVEFFRSQA